MYVHSLTVSSYAVAPDTTNTLFTFDLSYPNTSTSCLVGSKTRKFLPRQHVSASVLHSFIPIVFGGDSMSLKDLTSFILRVLRLDLTVYKVSINNYATQIVRIYFNLSCLLIVLKPARFFLPSLFYFGIFHSLEHLHYHLNWC